MSARTVQKHLEHILGKLGVETRTAAVAAGALWGGTEGAGLATLDFMAKIC